MDIADKIISKVEETKKAPQHVIDEERAELIREKKREQSQMEMFDDPVMNWSGNR